MSIELSPVTRELLRDVDSKKLKRALKQRDRLGFKVHGKPLIANDGRDWIQESLDEVLDLCQYLKAEIIRLGQSDVDLQLMLCSAIFIAKNLERRKSSCRKS